MRNLAELIIGNRECMWQFNIFYATVGISNALSIRTVSYNFEFGFGRWCF